MPKKAPALNPGIILVSSYFLIFAVNVLVVLLANLIFPDRVVLGTAQLTKVWALVLSMGTLTLLNTLLIPFINQYESTRSTPFTPTHWIAMYFVINAAGLWLITRASHIFGLGASSWLVIVLLAIIIDIAQGFGMMQLESQRQS